METSASNFWWLKGKKSASTNATIENDNTPNLTYTPTPLIEDPSISSSLQEFIEKERALQSPGDGENTDIGSLIEEINKLAAQSPLGPYENDHSGRSFEDIMKEAEKIYIESSRSFEQLSIHSRTSANLSVSLNDSPDSTPTPKSASPLPLDTNRTEDEHKEQEDLSYSDDFSPDEVSESISPPILDSPREDEVNVHDSLSKLSISKAVHDEIIPSNTISNNSTIETVPTLKDEVPLNAVLSFNKQVEDVQEEAFDVVLNDDQILKNPIENKIITNLEEENANLLANIDTLKVELDQTKTSLSEELKKVPLVTSQLEKALEELKDSKESNTVLQLQLTNLNQTHQQLKSSYDEIISSSINLEKRVQDVELILNKYKTELEDVHEHRDKLAQNEENLQKMLEMEKVQVKNLKSQNDKDARCILDLTRQVKEMERIIARKHPDSVSALIVAAKKDHTENNLTARKLLEDRIKNLEEEVILRDQTSSKVFLEVQEKFTEMKNKYESHIEDLELHVNDLKEQLKRKVDSFDVYTQTMLDFQKIPAKETKDVGAQTLALARFQPQKVVKKPEKVECKDDAHLVATVRGLQNDLVNKEKSIIKLQKELDEAKKTNKRLQKEREGSLKNIAEKREFRTNDSNNELDQINIIKSEKDKMKNQLCRIEEDYQSLKSKRLFDLSALQQAHEDEMSTYTTTVKSLREQLETKQLTISTLQDQLRITKEHLEILSTERDDLFTRVNSFNKEIRGLNLNGNESAEFYQQKVAGIEQKYQERERRLRSILHELSLKTANNLNCQQCVARHQQLILYKNELDQLLATVRTLSWP